jgi:neutral ceramidase
MKSVARMLSFPVLAGLWLPVGCTHENQPASVADSLQVGVATAIVCLPCEIFVELGLAIKRALPFRHTLVISVCNARPSYVPTQKAFAEGSYEVTNARVKPGAGAMLVAAAVRLLGSLQAE